MGADTEQPKEIRSLLAAQRRPRAWCVLALASMALTLACKGGGGPAGNEGAAGPQGCAGLPGGATAGLFVTLTLSTPTNGQYFAPGERARATIRFADRCRALQVSDLGTANLYLYGPRGVFARTAAKLLNCDTNRAAPDRQHHFVNLKAPRFLDTAVTNLSQAADGTISFVFSPVTDEPPGSYTVGVHATSVDGVDQEFALADVQIGVAMAETYASGSTESSTCFDCHRTPGDGFAQMHHARPSVARAAGDWALDLRPVATCKACHNVDGYSSNPLVRKVHGLHRGARQQNPGAAHPDYGLASPDATLPEYLDVVFPSMPGAEKDCTKCHTDDRWKTRPSRLACGTCHDNLSFDTGVLSPARVYGKPAGISCAGNGDCAIYGAYAICDTIADDPDLGSCIHDAHSAAVPDSGCTGCHNEDPAAVSSISGAHEIYVQTRAPGLALTNVALTGATGVGPMFQVGDVPAVTFTLADRNGPITDLKNNSTYALTAIVAGPTDDRQRLFRPLSKTGGTLTGGASGNYTFVFPAPIPTSSEPPLNATGPVRVNPPGTYTLWLYVNKIVIVGSASFRDVANGIVDFKFGDGTIPVRPRRIVTEAACNSCHREVQAHGGGRSGVVEMCSACHGQYAVDRSLDRPDQAIGAPCIQAAPACGLFQTCQPAPAGVGPPSAPNDGYCILNPDPTPGNTIEFGPMIHAIHFARLRAGYAERNFLSPYTGKLAFTTTNNNVVDLSQGLFPEDVRQCDKCHADAANGCSAIAPCGIGQECLAGVCRNRAWTSPSSRVCLSCHDTDYAAGHAAINTWSSPDGPVETCNACHDTQDDFSVEKVHAIRNPYVPTYQRTPP